MTDGQLLYVVFIVLYIADGLGRYPQSASLFVKPWWSKKWFLKKPRDVAARLGEGYYVLPMLGRFLPSSEGWWFSEPDKKQIRWIESPDTSPAQAAIKNPKRLWRDRSRLEGPKNTGKWVFSNLTTAIDIRKWLNSLLPSAEVQTPAIHKRLSDSLSLPRAKAAVKKAQLIERQFAFSNWLLTIYCFLVLPALFSYCGGGLRGLKLILAIFPFTFLIGCTWWIVIGRVFPQLKKGRWYKVLPVIFLPHHALRVSQQLSLECSSGCHPLALGRTVLREKAFSHFVGDYMRRLRFPLVKNVSEIKWKAQADLCAEFLEKNTSITLESLANESPEHDEISESYCPRCHSQYLDKKAMCDSCDGLKTISFDQN